MGNTLDHGGNIYCSDATRTIKEYKTILENKDLYTHNYLQRLTELANSFKNVYEKARIYNNIETGMYYFYAKENDYSDFLKLKALLNNAKIK